MIFTDSNIWCYYFDQSAEEHQEVSSSLESLIQNNEVFLNTLVAMELAHYLIKNLGPIKGKEKMDKFLSYPFRLIDFRYELMEKSIDSLAEYSHTGIGGRDATILASMKEKGIEKLVTHDKAFKRIEEIEVIDPVEE